MREQVVAALQGQPGVDDWLVREITVQSNQYFLAGRHPESRREATTRCVVAEVYSDHSARQGGQPSRGSASLTLVPGDERRLAERIGQAVFMAGLTDNPPFSLPGPAVYPAVLVADRRLQESPAAAAEQLAGQLLAAIAGEPGVSLASAEVFVDLQQVAVHNSRGAQAEEASTSLLLDFVLLARDKRTGQETEAHLEVGSRALATLDLPALARRQARFARDTLGAGPPQSGRFPVIVSDDALRDLLAGTTHFSPFAFRAGAEYRYQRLTPWEIGKSVFGDAAATGDPLTVYANAVLPWGTQSASFGHDGLPAQRLQIVENGVLRHFWATSRYAQYLQVPPTGDFGNLEVLAGSTPVADMWQGEGLLYHVVAFSAMSPDPLTGDYVGEIRLGYERRGREMRPIKGGSLSGNLFADLAGARLSQETVLLAGYHGPQAVRFPALTVSGG